MSSAGMTHGELLWSRRKTENPTIFMLLFDFLHKIIM